MWKYFIPISGVIYMWIKPYETDNVFFFLTFFLWQIGSSFCVLFYLLIGIHYGF